MNLRRRYSFLKIAPAILAVLISPLGLAGISPVSSKKPANSSWPKTKVELKWEAPGIRFVSQDLEDALGLQKITADQRRTVDHFEKFIVESFAEIAAFYSANKLIEPLLPVRKGTDGVKIFQIYVYSFRTVSSISADKIRAGGFYTSNLCGMTGHLYTKTPDDDGDSELNIDVGKFFRAGYKFNSNTDDIYHKNLYGTIAHELFHAIQSAYDVKFSSQLECKKTDDNGYWPLIEGTATAVANIVTERRYPGFLKNIAKDDLAVKDNRIGAFPYSMYNFLKVGSPQKEAESGEPNPGLAYRTSSFWGYLAEKYGGLSFFDSMFRRPIAATADVGVLDSLSGNTVKIENRYKWLDQNIRASSDKKPLYLVFPEFLAEFASYPDSKKHELPGISVKRWERRIFGRDKYACHVVELNEASGWVDEIKWKEDDILVDQGTTCVDVRWSGIKDPFLFAVEATHPDQNIIDQLHLGVSDLENDGNVDNCSDWVEKTRSASLKPDCSFGKMAIQGRKGESSQRKEWFLDWPIRNNAFFSRKLGELGEATLILSNVGPNPWNTAKVAVNQTGDSGLIIRFSVRRMRTASATSLEPPTNLDMLVPAGIGSPDAGLNRYSFYGVVTGTRLIPQSQPLACRTVATGDSGLAYLVTPANNREFEFGRTGPFYAAVTVMSATNPLASGRNSMMCDRSNNPAPNAVITRSDAYQLRFSLKTDICTVDFATGQPKVVDRLDTEFFLPFGRKYYAATEQNDLITPGVEFYIDEYIRDAVALGIPIPAGVQLADGSSPYPDESSPNGGSQESTGSGSGGEGTSSKFVCTCSCKQIEEIVDSLEKAQRAKSRDPKLMPLVRCMQKCMPNIASCQRQKSPRRSNN